MGATTTEPKQPPLKDSRPTLQKRSTSATSSSRTTRHTTGTSRFSHRPRTERRRSGTSSTSSSSRNARKACSTSRRSPVRSRPTPPDTSIGRTRSSSAYRLRRRLNGPSCPTAASVWSSPRSRPTGMSTLHVVEAFTKYRKTHNEGVFDAYTADIRARRSSIFTGLPTPTGAGESSAISPRCLYGVKRLIERRNRRKQPRLVMSTDDIIRDREELSEQIRAQRTAADGLELRVRRSVPARTSRGRPVALPLAYLAPSWSRMGRDVAGRVDVPDVYFRATWRPAS